jgi:transcriptional regulator with XRE-family HTH domain
VSVIEYAAAAARVAAGSAARPPTAERPLHRLHEVRVRQGVSRRTVARRLQTDVGTVRQQERPHCDVSLSTLYEWQEVLDVPVAELLVEPEEPLSAPVMKRAQLVRLMKTAAAIRQRAEQPGIQRMAQVLIDQLVEIMPELAEVSPWHAVGKRRTQDEIGQAAHRGLTANWFHDPGD